MAARERPTTSRDYMRGASGLVTAINEGGTTAIDVVVQVIRGKEPELVEFRAIPKGHEEEASVTVPGSGEPKASVIGFEEP